MAWRREGQPLDQTEQESSPAKRAKVSHVHFLTGVKRLKKKTQQRKQEFYADYRTDARMIEGRMTKKRIEANARLAIREAICASLEKL